MKKHAYLIMAHGDWTLLSKLLQTLDDPRNDLFVHIDAKAHFSPADVYVPKQAGCTYIQRLDVNWGGDSQIKCELALLQEAVKNCYAYYHLLSGADLPLKSQDEIHHFFLINQGKNYIRHNYVDDEESLSLTRIREYHFLQNQIGRKTGWLVGILYRAEQVALNVQRILRINRIRQCPKALYKGANWFSIDHAMAMEVISEIPFIQKYFFHSLCADEFFLQTVAMNSSLKDTVENEDLRYIDWDRGSPYTFTSEDYDILMASKKLFARKFSDYTDDKITSRIASKVSCCIQN